MNVISSNELDFLKSHHNFYSEGLSEINNVINYNRYLEEKPIFRKICSILKVTDYLKYQIMQLEIKLTKLNESQPFIQLYKYIFLKNYYKERYNFLTNNRNNLYKLAKYIYNDFKYLRGSIFRFMMIHEYLQIKKGYYNNIKEYIEIHPIINNNKDEFEIKDLTDEDLRFFDN